MAKDPAFLFYPQDFLTGVTFLSNEQRGIYITLLCAQHQMGGMIDKSSFNSLVGLHDIIRGKFIESENGYYNVRLMEEMQKRSKKSTNISQAVKDVWEKRKKAIALESHNKLMESHTKNDGIAMGIEDEDSSSVLNNKDTHKIFAKKLFDSDLEKDEIEISTHKKVTEKNLKEFNAHLGTESKHHSNYSEYKKHYKNWLSKKTVVVESKQYKKL